MDERFAYLLELGYTGDEIAEYSRCWAEGILSYLADNSYNVLRNMSYIKEDLERELLLKFPVFYPETFVMNHESFKKYIDLIRRELPDYKELFVKQFWAYEGVDSIYAIKEEISNEILYIPLLQVVGMGDENQLCMAISSLKEPSQRLYKFIMMLNKELGVSLTAEDFPEDCLLDLEISKWEVLRNSEFLLAEGLSEDIVCRFYWSCPWLLTCSVEGLQATLQEEFGENYIEVICDYEDHDSLSERLISL